MYTLAEDANHDLWIRTWGGGLSAFATTLYAPSSKAQGLTDDIVTSIVPARDGSIWFATPKAASRMRNGQVRNYTTADGLSNNHAVALYEDRDGNIWVGTVRRSIA